MLHRAGFRRACSVLDSSLFLGLSWILEKKISLSFFSAIPPGLQQHGIALSACRSIEGAREERWNGVFGDRKPCI